LASNYGTNEIVNLLIIEGADVDKSFSGDDTFPNGTPLILAVKNNHVSTVELLLQNDANINKIDGKRNYPLLIAIQEKNIPMIDLLLKVGADANFKRGILTPLMKATMIDDIHIIDRLLTNPFGAKASINLRASSGSTAFYTACENGNVNVAKKLIKLGADINISNMFNGSPLMIAIKNGHESIVDLLLELGAKLENVDELHETALFVAVRAGNLSIIDKLLKAGSDAGHINNSDNNVIQVATALNLSDVVELLTKHSKVKSGSSRKTIRHKFKIRKNKKYSRKTI
jgi:ankyrin repeat protein